MKDTVVSSLLRQIPYFASIDEARLAALADQAVHCTYRRGEVISLEGDPSAGLWVLESGRVKAYKLGLNGQEFILRFLGPGDTFNDLAALDGAANPLSIMALTEASAWVLPTEVFAEALHTDPQLAEAVVHGLVGRVRQLIGQVEDLALRPVTARLARFLLDEMDDATLPHPAVTRALIANHLATTPESVSRSLRVLEDAGAIRFDRHRIIIARSDVLHDMAQMG